MVAHIYVNSQTPGPGTYREQNELSREGRYVKSSDKNSCVPTFKLPLKKHAEERVGFKSYTKDVPGPGSYTVRETSNNNKYRNNYDLQLYKKERKIELHDKTKLDIPGPETYNLPSDFGNTHMIPFHARKKNSRVRTRNLAYAPTQSQTLIGLNQSSQIQIDGSESKINPMTTFSQQMASPNGLTSVDL